ncbi:MAG: molybdopterin-binding protein [Clostridiales bacterium]|jgi:hypothetical protein|nr:molybdopterin-binding protein [Clostridiales bacterium]
MKLVRTEEAVGQVLCHDITQILKGASKAALFRKGHVISQDDIPALLNLGKDHIYAWEISDNMLHEDDAAEILRTLCQSEHMSASAPKEGKIELFADMDGLLIIDRKRLQAVNSLGQIAIACRLSGFPVKKGDKLCGMRVIPLAIERERMAQAEEVAGREPLLKILPIKAKKYGLAVTGNEVYFNRIKDEFTPVVEEKLAEYGCEMMFREVLSDDSAKITAAINSMLDSGAEMVLCTGGMSVDPDDKTPLAIKSAGARIVSYGAPVLPGSMFLFAYSADGRPICGLPGCVMYSGRTIFDLALPFILADMPVTPEWLAGLGNGGLCLNCETCHFPNCMFGKGV